MQGGLHLTADRAEFIGIFSGFHGEIIAGSMGFDFLVCTAKHISEFAARIRRICRGGRVVGSGENHTVLVIEIEKIAVPDHLKID